MRLVKAGTDLRAVLSWQGPTSGRSEGRVPPPGEPRERKANDTIFPDNPATQERSIVTALPAVAPYPPCLYAKPFCLNDVIEYDRT